MLCAVSVLHIYCVEYWIGLYSPPGLDQIGVYCVACIGLDCIQHQVLVTLGFTVLQVSDWTQHCIGLDCIQHQLTIGSGVHHQLDQREMYSGGLDSTQSSIESYFVRI